MASLCEVKRVHTIRSPVHAHINELLIPQPLCACGGSGISRQHTYPDLTSTDDRCPWTDGDWFSAVLIVK